MLREPALRAGRLAFVLAIAPAAAAGAPTVEIAWDAEYRLRPEVRDGDDLDRSRDDTRSPWLSRLRLRLTATAGKHARFVFQAQDSRVFGEEASTASNERNLDLHQGYVELGDVRGAGARLALGRMEWAYGDERLLGSFGWDNVGRSFDGARASLPLTGGRLDLLWARTARLLSEEGPESSQDLFGAYFSRPLAAGSAFDLYVLAFRDGRRLPGERAGEAGRTFLGAFGARLEGRRGRLDLSAEGVVETGSERGDALRALAFGGSAGLTLGGSLRARPFFGYDFATGDRDPADGEREEVFNFFPTNHIHYGQLDLFGWRNLRSPYAGVEVLSGSRRLTVRLHHFALDEARGPWRDAGGKVLGFDPQGRSGRSVGQELDLVFATPLPAGLSLLAGYGHFFPDRFARATRGRNGVDFGYAQLTYRFASRPGG